MNTLTAAFDQAEHFKEATQAQPHLLEVPGADVDELKKDLADSSSAHVRFARVADMMVAVAGEIKECKDFRAVGGHVRRALVVAAAAMPNHQLTAQDSLIEEWRAANAKIDLLEEEKALLEQKVAELNEQVESLGDKLSIRTRQIQPEIAHVLALVNNSKPLRVNFVFDRTAGHITEIPAV